MIMWQTMISDGRCDKFQFSGTLCFFNPEQLVQFIHTHICEHLTRLLMPLSMKISLQPTQHEALLSTLSFLVRHFCSLLFFPLFFPLLQVLLFFSPLTSFPSQVLCDIKLHPFISFAGQPPPPSIPKYEWHWLSSVIQTAFLLSAAFLLEFLLWGSG